jgi:phospholipid/cholesterol/gamma-HCH transport system ATP-binding protein
MSEAPKDHALIEVRNLVKRFSGKTVLNHFNLSITRGETCAIIGESGSGKSTFARLLVGLEPADSGEIWVDGVNLVGLHGRALDRLRLKFAFVFQGHALLDSMSVFDNVAFPMREQRHFTPAEIAARAHLALRELDIDEASSKLPGQLSGGMAKRVGIARAIVIEPEILVYDEPTSGLDPLSSRVVDGLIERMRTAHGVTSIVITHDMVTAYSVADRVVLLAHGQAVADGPPEELFRSHGKEIEPFALSSGIDLTRMTPRTDRIPPSEIRAQWEKAHPKGTAIEPHRWWPWLHRAPHPSSDP